MDRRKSCLRSLRYLPRCKAHSTGNQTQSYWESKLCAFSDIYRSCSHAHDSCGIALCGSCCPASAVPVAVQLLSLSLFAVLVPICAVAFATVAAFMLLLLWLWLLLLFSPSAVLLLLSLRMKVLWLLLSLLFLSLPGCSHLYCRCC